MSDQISHIVTQQRTELRAIKVYLVATTEFMKLVGEDSTDSYFANCAELLTEADDVDSFVSQQLSQIKDKIENFVREGSGWVVEKLKKLDVCLTK